MHEMKRKALIVFFTQSGQLKNIIDAITEPLKEDFDLVFEELRPEPEFPFPWKGMSFYQAFPESRMEIPCQLKPFSFDPETDFDLIILAYQPWYLSPSIPMTSFLQTKEAKRVMKDKPVISILGCRNMWIMAQESIKKRLAAANAKLIGNIVLADPHHNLVSVVTIVRWMLKGEKKGKGLYGRIFPEAGVTATDIAESSKYGEIIKKSFRDNDYAQLQQSLLDNGAVKIKPVLLAVEKRGYMLFKPWAKFVLKKGHYGETARVGRLKMFRAYLFSIIYLVSPFGGAIFWLIYVMTPHTVKKMNMKYAHIKNKS
jgi:hypothetical protein